MDVWNNEDYTITVRRERREDTPYAVNVVGDGQKWFRTLDEAMEYARSVDDSRKENPSDTLTFL